VVEQTVLNRLRDGLRQVLDGIVLARRSEQLPLTGHALKHVRSAVVEDDPRTVDEVLDGAGNQNLPSGGQGADPGPDVDCDSADVFAP
jgi:hypothetical protein